jgi:hypothetical protein
MITCSNKLPEKITNKKMPKKDYLHVAAGRATRHVAPATIAGGSGAAAAMAAR